MFLKNLPFIKNTYSVVYYDDESESYKEIDKLIGDALYCVQQELPKNIHIWIYGNVMVQRIEKKMESLKDLNIMQWLRSL